MELRRSAAPENTLANNKQNANALYFQRKKRKCKQKTRKNSIEKKVFFRYIFSPAGLLKLQWKEMKFTSLNVFVMKIV